MPAILAFLVGSLHHVAAYLVGRILFALGVTIVTYFGVSELLDYIYATVDSTWAVMSSEALLAKGVQMLGILRVDVCIDILIAAYAGRLSLLGMLEGGFISRLVTRFPS